MKAWTKTGRKFLNTEASGCVSTVSWRVAFTPGQPDSTHKWARKAAVEAEFGVSEDACSHYITRKGDLRPLRNLRAELDKFEQHCSAAFADMEKADGKAD